MKKTSIILSALLVAALVGATWPGGLTWSTASAQSASKAAPTPAELDKLLAPVALYPDSLLAQILMSAGDPAGVTALDKWLKSHPTLKGTDLQDAAVKDNFQPSFVALTLFPQTVAMMAKDLDWTTKLGQAFANHRTNVFDSIQRLRGQAQKAGHLKSTPQQDVETQTTSAGQEVIVIEPSNPQVVYVPQYNPQTVYVTAPTTTTVVVQESSSSADAAVAGMIGFTAGIAIGAAVNNNYYYGPYGWHGGAYMYNDAWNDYYDHREDAREDWIDHREDLADERTDRRENTQEQRTDRQENRTENRPEASQAQKDQARANAQSRQQSGTQSAGTRSAGTQSAGTQSAGTRSTGASTSSTPRATQRSGTSSDAFSGYSSGKSQRAASSRGASSRGSSRSGGGGRRR